MNQKDKNPRRNFLKLGLLSGVSAVAGITAAQNPGDAAATTSGSGEKIKVLTPEGKLIEIDKPAENNYPAAHVTPEAARKGIPNRRFVMVIDLSKCKNARACIDSCQHAHQLPKHQEYMKVQLMQDVEEGSPYWFPKPCFHCSEPPCVKVCPTGATFKREDNIVLVDNEQCIGCKFCVTSCPYSARVFNWDHHPNYEKEGASYSPETGVPGQVGTVSKCDFCPDMLRAGKLPHCASACPMGVIYFGDANEDIVTNGSETLRFSELITDGSAYQYLSELGTKPNVYYLPPVNRQFPVDRGFPEDDPELMERYKNVSYVKKMNQSNTN